MRIRGIDLFCGGGGSSWGATQAGIEMVGAVDAWDVAGSTYKLNFPNAQVITSRLTDDSGPELFDSICDVDIVIASPECTHHSVARGNRPRCDESRRSSWYVMRFIREMKPRWVVLENVTAMRNWHGYEELIKALREDYELTVQLLDAADFAVPQTRRRLFIMGDRERKPCKIEFRKGQRLPASTILDPAGTWTTTPAFSERRAPATAARIRRGIEELGPGEDFLVVYYSTDAAGGWQPLNRPLRTLTTLDRFGLVQWIDGEPRLRMLQVPELQRAMGFKPILDREFNPGCKIRRDRIKILGNGVCPNVMESVVRSLTTGEAIDRLAA